MRKYTPTPFDKETQDFLKQPHPTWHTLPEEVHERLLRVEQASLNAFDQREQQRLPSRQTQSLRQIFSIRRGFVYASCMALMLLFLSWWPTWPPYTQPVIVRAPSTPKKLVQKTIQTVRRVEGLPPRKIIGPRLIEAPVVRTCSEHALAVIAPSRARDYWQVQEYGDQSLSVHCKDAASMCGVQEEHKQMHVEILAHRRDAVRLSCAKGISITSRKSSFSIEHRDGIYTLVAHHGPLALHQSGRSSSHRVKDAVELRQSSAGWLVSFPQERIQTQPKEHLVAFCGQGEELDQVVDASFRGGRGVHTSSRWLGRQLHIVVPHT
ncbi:MAG TPA: hypothetical protein DCE42_27190 [Myxococcales bacterium]|nr:hypothetical protein [Deltaproteobacteria bacterium]MBU49643.1 hypothetical protein [Deltaproteobacteria bacterium]HAA58478.1 hypothetical protein [Myxococcales bacterium]|tara:strand:+ start:7198 stop:8163 length:966 start_codon:yes stop_codon:yes gene_type:complete